MNRRANSEDGVALITALLGVIILAGLAVVFTNRAVVETRASGTSQRYESTIHTTEGAADTQIAALNAVDEHVTRDGAGNEITMDSTDRADERGWSRGLVDQMRGSDAWVDDDLGEAFAVRPRDADTGEALDVVYAVGATPSFTAGNATIRTVKLQVAQDTYTPDHALLTEGTLKFSGSGTISSPGCDDTSPETAEATCIADVHTNSNIEGQSSAASIEGRVTVSDGSCSGAASSATNGCLDADVSPQPIPPFTARDFYNRGDDQLNPDPVTGTNVEWFDLCSDGVVRTPTGGEPCTGVQRWPDPNDTENTTDFYGWKWKGPQNQWQAGSLKAGVFYVHHADAAITGTEGGQQRAVSVIVESDPNNKQASGSLQVSGNPRLQAGLSGVLFITDRDLDLGGRAGAAPSGTNNSCDLAESYSGFIGVGEQIDIPGNVKVKGAVVVQDTEEEHGLVRRPNDVLGNMCLEFDQDLVIDLTGIWVVTFWNEL